MSPVFLSSLSTRGSGGGAGAGEGAALADGALAAGASLTGGGGMGLMAGRALARLERDFFGILSPLVFSF